MRLFQLGVVVDEGMLCRTERFRNTADADGGDEGGPCNAPNCETASSAPFNVRSSVGFGRLFS